MKKNSKIKDDDFKRMKKVPHKRNKYIDKSFHFYLSYISRVILMLISILIIGWFSYTCFKDSFNDSVDEKLSYTEEGNIKSNVIYLEGNLFETGQLNSNGSYVSDYIDDIGITFNYKYELDKAASVKYSYDVVSTMVLNGTDGKVISKTGEDKPINQSFDYQNDMKNVVIEQPFNLDYDYFNNLAKEINQRYNGITGYIELKMNVYIDIKYNKFDEVISEKSSIDVRIPVLSTNVTVEMVDKLDNKDTYVEHHKPKLVNKLSLYSGISLLIIDTIFLLLAVSFILKVRPKKSKYCTLRDGLLKDYDRIIVNSKKMIKVTDYNVIDCYSFSELMDAQRLLGKPIIYYEIVKNQKCMFVLIADRDAYIFTLKECDIEY